MGRFATVSAFALIGLRPRFGSFAPVWDEPPFQGVKRPLAGLMVLPDDQKFLRGRAIPTPRIVREAAVAYVETIDDRVFYRPSSLDHTSAHVSFLIARRQHCLEERATRSLLTPR
jgi:hypothetical protein